jgi:ATP-dependent DNA helicase RecG
MVLQYVQSHGRITRKDVMELCRLSPDQASHLLHRLATEDKLTLHGKNKGAYYTAP